MRPSTIAFAVAVLLVAGAPFGCEKHPTPDEQKAQEDKEQLQTMQRLLAGGGDGGTAAAREAGAVGESVAPKR